MSDFYQTGTVATLHRLGRENVDIIEKKLVRYASERPIALVLPSLFRELEGEALKNILEELQKVQYIKEVVITLGPASEKEFVAAKLFFNTPSKNPSDMEQRKENQEDIQGDRV